MSTLVWLEFSVIFINVTLLFYHLHQHDFYHSKKVSLRKIKIKNSFVVVMLSSVQLFTTPWTIASQAPLSMEIFQARILEWVAISFSRESSQPRDQSWFSCKSPTLQADSLPLNSLNNPTLPSCFWKISKTVQGRCLPCDCKQWTQLINGLEKVLFCWYCEGANIEHEGDWNHFLSGLGN